MPPDGVAVQVVDCPACNEEGEAAHETVSNGGVTVTVAEAEAAPLALLHETKYEVLWVGDKLMEPEVAPPVEKLVPVQEVAFAEDQESVDD